MLFLVILDWLAEVEKLFDAATGQGEIDDGQDRYRVWHAETHDDYLFQFRQYWR